MQVHKIDRLAKFDLSDELLWFPNPARIHWVPYLAIVDATAAFDLKFQTFCKNYRVLK
jgi:hypothetical protein